MRKLKALLVAALATMSAAAGAGNYCSPFYNPYWMDGRGGTSCDWAFFTEYTPAGVETFELPLTGTGWVGQVTGSNGSIRTFTCTNGTQDVLDDQGYSDWYYQ